MKTSTLSYPVLSDVEVTSRSTAETKAAERQLAAKYFACTVVVLAGSVMTFCLISYGQIFQNYLKW